MGSALGFLPSAIDGSQVVWLSDSIDEILSEPLGGDGAAPTMLATVSPVLTYLFAQGGNAYWADPATNTIAMASLAGGPSTVLVSGVAVSSMALTATDAYFTDIGTGQLESVPLSGGVAATPLVPVGVFDGFMVADSTNVYVASSENESGAIYEWPLAGGVIKTLTQSSYASGETFGVMATFGGTVYWAQAMPCGGGMTYGIWEVKSDGTGAMLDVPGFDEPLAMAADDTYVYVATQTAVYRFDR